MGPVLVVDLDGTLIRSDLLHACLWSAATLHLAAPLGGLWPLLRGRAALKRRLAGRARVEVATLTLTFALVLRQMVTVRSYRYPFQRHGSRSSTLVIL